MKYQFTIYYVWRDGLFVDEYLKEDEANETRDFLQRQFPDSEFYVTEEYFEEYI